MSLSSYFSDNQSKQKAYDRYYNQTALSDFVQRRKLRALIAQEAADESLTDKLAQLYMSSVGKAPDYEYDMVLKKIQKARPEVKTGPTVEIPRGGFTENLRSKTRAAQNTPDTESERKSMDFFNDLFERDTRALKTTRAFKADSYGDAKQKAQREARKYVEDYQKRARSDKVNANRVLTPDQEEFATKKVAKRILSGFKRDRKDSVVSAKPESKRRLFDEAEDATDVGEEDDEEEKMSAEQQRREQELKKLNPGLRSQYQRMAKDEFIAKENYDREAFFKRFRREFRANIDLRHGDGYFKRHFQRPDVSLPNDQKNFDNYKKKITTILNKALPV
ncbi:unnamed protein product [Phytophthora lilii]|uniref:Unnamed protein product n=1 Tax=Phytophthora lilii TaxID=2077276 RepID=A0A9W6X8U2_9STRA|nr:unnamed protein product [Phytophthora lilii]